MAEYVHPSKLIPSSDVELLLGEPDVSRWTGRRDRLAMLLMLRCGLRVSEALALRGSQVVRRGDLLVLEVREGKATVGKSKKVVRPRNVPCPPDAAAALEAWLAECVPCRDGYLIPSRDGRQLDRRQMYRRVKMYAEKAGIAHVHPHMLRHTYASNAIRDNFSLPEVSYLVGHGNLRSTMVYLHPDEDSLAQKMKGWTVYGTEEATSS